MKRREALKSIGLVTGGIVLMPSCNLWEEKVSIALNNLQITSQQETLLREIVDIIIPEDPEIPGGVSLEAHNFVWIMIDDCEPKENQDRFINGLNQFEVKAKELKGKKFCKLNDLDKLEAINSLMVNSENELEADINPFLQTTKYYTVRGYMQSEHIMTEVFPYKLVPGTFGLCETIYANTKINPNA
ncbi:gluconate 2-dehydrogenase subunit 3 family protein [Flavobacteriaceae sp. LMIT009]